MSNTLKTPPAAIPTWGEIVAAVRTLVASDRAAQGLLAAELGVTYKQVWNILNRSTDGTWKNGRAMLQYLAAKGTPLTVSAAPMVLVSDPDYRVQPGDLVELRVRSDAADVKCRAPAESIPAAVGSCAREWFDRALRVWTQGG